MTFDFLVTNQFVNRCEQKIEDVSYYRKRGIGLRHNGRNKLCGNLTRRGRADLLSAETKISGSAFTKDGLLKGSQANS